MRSELFLENISWPQERGPVMSESDQYLWRHLYQPEVDASTQGVRAEKTEGPKSFSDWMKSRWRCLSTRPVLSSIFLIQIHSDTMWKSHRHWWPANRVSCPEADKPTPSAHFVQPFVSQTWVMRQHCAIYHI